MTVVSRDDTEELQLTGFSGPGGSATRGSVEERGRQILIHEGEAGISTGQHLVLTHTKQLRTKTPCFWDSLESAVVSDVDPVLCQILAVENRVEPIGKGKLLGARFTPREIQLQTLCLEGRIRG